MASLWTKYRPKNFSEVVGQDETVKRLENVIKAGRAKTFLFIGSSGVGKTTLARIAANEFAGGEATLANIEEIDAATHTGVEAMREVASKAHYRAIGASSIKAIIVDEAHNLSKSAWDALLKATEEPPAHVYWMLCTTNPSKIPKTIQTRFLRFDLRDVNEADLEKLIRRVVKKEQLDLDDEIIEAIVENSENSPRQALVNLESCAFAENVSEAREILRTASQSPEVIDLARFLISNKRKQWTEVTSLIRRIDNIDPESTRIIIINYFATALKGAKSDNEALRLLAIMEAFSVPYIQSDKDAPLLMSIAEAIGIGR